MKKRLLHVIIIFFLITILLIDVVSAFGLSVFMTPSTTNVQTSSEVVIKVKVSNLDVGENGINSFSGTLNYDTEVFEVLTVDDITGLNNWTASYTPDSGKIVLFKTTFVNSDEELFQITLKTKSEISKNSGAVSLKNIIVSNGDDEISATEVNTSIAIGSGITIVPGNTSSNNTVNKVANKVNNTAISITNKANNVVSNYNNTNTSISNKVNNTSVQVNNTINNNESITNEVVPHTGTRENVRIALIVLLVVAGYIYIKFEKLNKVC